MKYILSITLIFAFVDSPIPKNYQKKINKVIKKKYDLKEYDLKVDSICSRITKERNLSGEIYSISSVDANKGYLYFNSIRTCKVGGCTTAADVKTTGAYEFFDLAIFMDQSFNIIEIKILKYFSDYGYEITSKSYLKKFYNKTPCDLKEAPKLDGISGATISANSLIDEIHNLCL